MKKRTCTKCLITKTLNCFYKRRAGSKLNDYMTSCKDCHKKANLRSTFSEDRLNRKRETDRLFFKRHPNILLKTVKEYQKKYPERTRAVALVNRMIKKGKITRQNCEVCGSTKVHAHHDDYSKPLEVRWLCPMHHRLHHLKIIN